MSHAGTDRLNDWLVLGQERWDLVERRNQLLLRALTARNPGVRVVFVETALRPRAFVSWRLPRVRPVAPNIWALAPLRPFPDGVSRRLSDRLEAAQIRRSVRAVGLQRTLLWTQDPRAADLLDRLPAAGLVYDLTDDWVAFESDPVRAAEVRSRVDSLCERADLVLACSRVLEADARRVSARVLYLPNAVELAGGPDAPVPAELARLPGPRLGYFGTLHPARLDLDLAVQAAALAPDWSFVFLGPNLLSESDSVRLFSPPNVHYLGVVPHAELSAYLAGLDVGLVTHLVNDFTRSLDPLKTYEYLAAGLPVVSTAAGIPSDLAELITEVSSAPELIAAAAAAIADDSPQQAQRRRAAVAAQTWDARAAAIETALATTPSDVTEPEVSVVIISFNTRELLERCLTAVHAQRGVQTQVVVVDNASADGSREMVRDRFAGVQLLELDSNVGFAAANNVAFPQCRGEFVLLLNSDAFLHEGALAALVDAARRHPGAGALGPRLLNLDQTLQRSAWPFPDPARLMAEALGLHRILRRTPFYEDLGVWGHDTERTVDFLIGACLLLRRAVLVEVGGFDESFWMYAEEADLQQRLWAAGYSVMFTPAAQVTHIGGASDMQSAERLRHFYAGQLKFLRQHRGRWAPGVARAALLIGSALRRRWAAVGVALRLGREP